MQNYSKGNIKLTRLVNFSTYMNIINFIAIVVILFKIF